VTGLFPVHWGTGLFPFFETVRARGGGWVPKVLPSGLFGPFVHPVFIFDNSGLRLILAISRKEMFPPFFRGILSCDGRKKAPAGSRDLRGSRRDGKGQMSWQMPGRQMSAIRMPIGGNESLEVL